MHGPQIPTKRSPAADREKGDDEEGEDEDDEEDEEDEGEGRDSCEAAWLQVLQW
jgi:hypothetical protein